ncbi:MAG: uroporphyrinogen-III synthase, partial [Alphaproteobacteria bacterium]|nr:uroporphyrinogen-III synthase [Alphaproteobacteria bacterium]
QAAGFRRVESAAGDGEALARLAAARCERSAGPLLHASGEAVAGDLAGDLAEAGFRVRREVLYRARAAEAFSPALMEELGAGGLCIALFFSPRSAAVFAKLARRSGVEESCRSVHACVLSEAVGRALEGVAWREVRVAGRPDHEAMMAEVDRILEAPGIAGEGCR